MSRWEKLLDHARNNPKGVRFDDACRLAERFGFIRRPQGGGTSHHVFKRPGFPRTLNFQNANGFARPMQVRQLLAAIDEIEKAEG
jgi:hypothetical protein